ncbi:MAG: SRPBCC family protein [Bacteroidota bacterium]
MGQKQKKVQQFSLSKVMELPAEQVWAIVGEDYGKIAHSHPKIIASNYVDGTLVAGEGAQRICYFNEEQTQYLKEKMVNYAPDRMSFTNKVYQAGKFPVDPNYTQAVYQVKDLGNGKSEFSFHMKYRTKPAFMGLMAKGKFKKLVYDYFIAVEHYVRTGEEVTNENFKEIKKLYTKHSQIEKLRALVASFY